MPCRPTSSLRGTGADALHVRGARLARRRSAEHQKTFRYKNHLATPMPTSVNPSAKRPCASGQGWLMRCRVARPRTPSCRKTARDQRPLAYKPIPTPLYRPLAARRRRSTARNNPKNASGVLLRPGPLWQVHPLAPWVTLAPVPGAPPEPEPPLLAADPLLPPVTMPPPPPAAAPPVPPPRLRPSPPSS